MHVPLPLPEQLVIFGLGQWESSESISAEVLVSAQVQAQNIGVLSAQTRCLTWEGDWNQDISAAAKGKKSVHVFKIMLTVCREENKDRVLSSSPLVHRKWSFPQGHHQMHHCSTFLQNTMSDTIFRNCSEFGDSVCYGQSQVNTSDFNVANRPAAWLKDEPPRQTILGKRSHQAWSTEDMDNANEECTSKKKILLTVDSQEEVNAGIKIEPAEEKVVCTGQPSERWSHSMCLIDPHTAFLYGGETTDHNYCKDSLWKLQLDSDLWLPMDSCVFGPLPLPAQGHSATFDPDSKAVYVYGGLREGLAYNELYILNTQNWKWTLVFTKGNIPTLAYHSAVFYKKELFVFGGVTPSNTSGEKICSNALYIFNLEHGLWYQPIVDGNKPLPRFGHSMTLLSNNLIIFGGRKTVTYLNDLYILDLGMMEYSAVKCKNTPPLSRGFHSALPFSNNQILVSGGCCALGALQDVHIFNIDTRMWTSVVCPPLTSMPRAGHSILGLGCTVASHKDQDGDRDDLVTTQCELLVFGGSDGAGNFYNDTIKCTVEF